MVKRFAFALLVVSTPAFAQPAIGPTTPTVVATPNAAAPQVTPWIYREGNLRLSIACAETWVTPDLGLALTVDGAPIDPQRINGRWSTYIDSNGNTGDVWSPHDVGYLLAPGRHHVEIDAPDCSPSTFDVDADPAHADHAIGRLALDDRWLEGPVGAPNGFGVTAGLWFAPSPRGPTSSSIFMQNASFDPGHTATGGYVSVSHEHRNLVIAADFAFAGGSASGAVSGSTVFGTAGPQSFTATVFDSADQLRFGARLPLSYVALEAGTGVGAEWWTTNGQLVGSSTSGLFAPSGIDGTFYLPVWAAATLKPTCDWGVQLMAQYDVHPTSMDTNGVTVAAGIMYQPSDSCSEPAGVRVSQN